MYVIRESRNEIQIYSMSKAIYMGEHISSPPQKKNFTEFSFGGGRDFPPGMCFSHCTRLINLIHKHVLSYGNPISG